MGAKVSTERGDGADGGFAASDEESGSAPAPISRGGMHEEAVEIRKEGESSEELSVHFGYQCQGGAAGASSSATQRLPPPPPESDADAAAAASDQTVEDGFTVSLPNNGWKKSRRNSSFTSLSGAALGANATLANSSICNGRLGEEILPGLDSPKTFRRMDSILRTSSLKSDLSGLTMVGSAVSMGSKSVPKELGELTSPTMTSPANAKGSFLNAEDVQMAGGAAGEDRVQAVCSEDNGWLFCGIYDGFNGRDAADYLAATLYENIGMHLRLLEWKMQKQQALLDADSHSEEDESMMADDDRHSEPDDGHAANPVSPPPPQASSSSSSSAPAMSSAISTPHGGGDDDDTVMAEQDDGGGWLLMPPRARDPDDDSLQNESLESQFRQGVLHGLRQALAHTESDFLDKVEQEMEQRPDLVMVGSCVLVVLMHGHNLYTLNLGDSRAVLATSRPPPSAADPPSSSAPPRPLYAVQLTDRHVVEDARERERIISEHPEDPRAISNGRLKGKLRVTRAFGAGYLKKAAMNNALMGILRVKDLSSPPYLTTEPSASMLQVKPEDQFVVVGSDGLFDFFTNDEVVQHVHQFLCAQPAGDPAKYMVDQLLLRSATNAGITVDQLKTIPIGRRRKYHDDVTIIVVHLGTEFHAAKASTFS